jgi:hypothetical protein
VKKLRIILLAESNDFALCDRNGAELMDVSLHEVLQIAIMGCGPEYALAHAGYSPLMVFRGAKVFTNSLHETSNSLN